MNLTIDSVESEQVLAAVGEWLARVYEVAARDFGRCDTLVCYLGDESLIATGFQDPNRQFARSAASQSAAMPDHVRELEWQIHCQIPPRALGDSPVLEEDSAFRLLASACLNQEQRGSTPLFFWDPEHAGTIRQLA